MTAYLGAQAVSVPAVVRTDTGYGLVLNEGGESKRLESTGSAVRGEPSVFEDRIAWIEEIDETATLRVWTGTASVDLATAERGHLLDPAIGKFGIAWTRFIGADWQIELERGGTRTFYGEPVVDDILPVVGETGIAWIGTREVNVWAYTTLGGLAEPIRLPGTLAERLRCRKDTLFWVSGVYPHSIAWTFENGAPRELGRNRINSHDRVPSVPRETPTAPTAEPLTVKVAWDLIPVDPKPDHRTTHAFLSIGEGKALVFAGEIWDASTEQMKGLDSETWILDTKELTFTKAEGAVSPSPRCHTPVAFDPTRNVALTFGGGGYDPEKGIYFLNDTWLFDTETRTWSEAKTTHSPEPDSDVGLVYDSVADRFVMYRHGEVWEFKMADRNWRRIQVSPGPAPRTCSAMVFDPTGNQILLWGGQIHPKYFDETWLLNLGTGEWKEVREGPRPSPRARAALVYDPESRSAIAYGGVRGPHSERFGDLWRFRFETERWELLAPEAPLSIGKRGGFFGMALGNESNEFYLFGGRSDAITFHNDLWRLRIGKAQE